MLGINKENISVYIITNGRSTFEYSYKALIQTCGDRPVYKIKDKTRPEALEEMIKHCSTEYVLRVEDDFMLHPKAFEYICFCCSSLPISFGMLFWNLWEDFSNQVVRSIKLYSVSNLKKIGGFLFDTSGKGDVITKKTLINRGFDVIEDKSILAVHACGTKEEEQHYINLWKSQAVEPDRYQKSRFCNMIQYTQSPEYQYNLRDGFLSDLNIKRDTLFGKFLMSKR